NEGVSYDFVQTAAQTRMNIKIVDKKGEATEASESGGPMTQQETNQLIANLDLLFSGKKGAKPDYFVISGSVPRGIEPSIYKTIGENAKACGIKVILDCDREALKQGITARPFIIKPNKYELEQYAGKKFDTDDELMDYAQQLSAEFGVKIVLTLGEKGAMYISHDVVYKVNAPKVEMRGFTGAGDSFLAAFITIYDKTNDPAEALRNAASFSAAKVELEGTMLPSKQDMTKYLKVIKAEKIR
ncbi:MAG: bifunctional hydroxymethylpyrimidine kinase/phosphomethylpyrimidine kinase, partial [Clostridia bacterium]|nr:bifunctional hydroxymethylpyrimidine kinase/phosphomethylpyrimidine kinase [Clostridia bacterium]